MATARTINKDKGAPLLVTCVPSSALKSSLDTMVAAGTVINHKLLVKFSYGANWEVAIADDNGIFDGVIVDCIPQKASPYYYLTVDVVSVIDQNSNRWTPRRVKNIYGSGTIALHDTVIVNGAAATEVDDGGTGGYGSVMAVDIGTTDYHDILF